MLRTNLSTRPFYNERAVQAMLGLFLLVVIAATAFNAIELLRLTSAQRRLGAHAVESEREAARLRTEAAAIRAQINPKDLETVASAAREANGIIDQRAFSWTDLLGEFEKTLPDDVRITAVQPRLTQQGAFIVGMTVQARRPEDLDAFIENLEKTGAFHNVTPLEEQTNDQGLLEAVVEGTYVGTGTPRG
jgi:Tfp pilus assembly protein PilN